MPIVYVGSYTLTLMIYLALFSAYEGLVWIQLVVDAYCVNVYCVR